MKRLYLLRHSKAGQTNKKLLDDHERFLTQKGIDMCAVMEEHLKNVFSENFPELVLCSTAVRAKETAQHALNSLESEDKKSSLPVEFISKLYLASPEDIFSTVRDLDNSLSSVVIIGHNPGMQQFCIMLAGKGNKKKFRDMRNNFPAPSLAVFDIVADRWSDIGVQSGILVDSTSGKALVSSNKANKAAA